ncbi:unnamed protein product [Cylindrotheca closterium]|uniref:HMG box domain-containing protein n=1 Tax=Cylindrotheca closterium TaxID=2856 RepID=A0AAD2CD41_9STRA|nr:unnamed protein product [Cylindrotheca closterium]
MSSTSAFVAILHCEAKNCEERAKNLRATANAIEAKAPVAGPAPAAKKRKRDEKSKRVHLAYSEFIKVNIEQFKKTHPDVPAREVVSIISRQWTNTSEEEKNIWRFRAEQLDMEQTENGDDDDDDDDSDNEHDIGGGEDENADKPPSLKDPPPDSDGILAEV